MSRRKLAIGIILILSLLIVSPVVKGLTLFPQDQTISIVDTHDDRWITEIGRLFDSPLVQILDPNMDITAYLIFRDVEINFWEPLTNATLRLRTTQNQTFDDSSVTIYGMKVDELQDISVGASFVLSVPCTSAFVNVNTSLFSGAGWHEIDVTAIVEELIRSYNWDGDGVTGTETGDAIGFVILGAGGSDARWFEDYRSSPANSAKLRIQWNHSPPIISPPDNYEFIEQYRNFSIWIEYPLSRVADYIWSSFPNPDFQLKYDNVEGTSYNTIHEISDASASSFSGQRKLVRTTDEILHVVYTATRTGFTRVITIKSIDNGSNWIDDTVISENDPAHSYQPSLAIDGNDVLHVVFIHDTDEVCYVNYTDSWSTPLVIGGSVGRDQNKPVIAIDSNNSIHIAWEGATVAYPAPKGQIWYVNYTDSWSTPFRISTDGDMGLTSQEHSSIAVDSNGSIHVVWVGDNGTYGVTKSQVWHREKTTGWGPITRISTYIGMELDPQTNPSIAIDPEDKPHVSWQGEADGLNFAQIWENHHNGTSWDYPTRISTFAGMHLISQLTASISFTPENLGYIVWSGTLTGARDIYLATYNGSWNVPTLEHAETAQESAPILRSPIEIPGPGTYFITDPNGTIVVTDLDDLDDAQDWIENEMGPDPLNPEPGPWEGSPDLLSRFAMRRYFLMIGWGMFWGPIWLFCYRRPSGYMIGAGFIFMLIGLGLLLQIPYI